MAYYNDPEFLKQNEGKYVNTPEGMYQIKGGQATLMGGPGENWVAKQIAAQNPAMDLPTRQRQEAGLWQGINQNLILYDPALNNKPLPGYEGAPVKSGFDNGLPIATAAPAGSEPATTERPAAQADFTAATTGKSAEVAIQMKDKNGNLINVYPSSIPQLVAEGTLPNGTVAPTGPTVGQPSNPVNRDLTAEQNFVKNWQGKGGALPTPAEVNQGVYGTANPSFTTKQGITPESLTPQQNINIPALNVPTTETADAVIAGAGQTSKSLTDLIASLTPAETEADKKEQSLLDMMASLTGQEGQKAADQLTQEQSAGLPALKTQFADINDQILTKTAEYNQLKTSYDTLSTENRNKTITMNSIIGSEAAINYSRLATLNAKAADIGLLQAQAQGLQGKITMAQETVNRSIDLKYSTIQAQLDTYQAQLNALVPTLNKEEKIRATAQQLILDNQKQALADKKTEDTNIKSIMLDAISKGITDQNVLSQISNAKSLQEAMTIYSKNMPDANVTDLQTKYPDAGITAKDTFAQAQAKLSKSRIYQDQVRGPVGSGGGGGVVGKISSLTQSIVDNPSLFDDLTPTNRGKVISELQTNGYDTANLGLKGLSDSAITTISQSQKALDDLASLKTIIQGNEDKLGPITGFARLNPWSESRKIQADVDRVRQTVGKALEGGVLRKEDEEKYKKILATLNDTPSTALYKIDALIGSIQRDIETYKSLQQSGGRSADVGAALQKKGTAEVPSQEDLRKKYNY